MPPTVVLLLSRASQTRYVDFRAGNCFWLLLVRYYVQKVAEEGMIAVAMAQSPEFVAPHGTKEAVFGTNPIGIGIPTNSKCDPLPLFLCCSAC